jgi:hypothetical protein
MPSNITDFLNKKLFAIDGFTVSVLVVIVVVLVWWFFLKK